MCIAIVGGTERRAFCAFAEGEKIAGGLIEKVLKGVFESVIGGVKNSRSY